MDKIKPNLKSIIGFIVIFTEKLTMDKGCMAFLVIKWMNNCDGLYYSSIVLVYRTFFNIILEYFDCHVSL